MEIKTVELTEVTLPDGSKAWFENKRSAEATVSLVEKMKELFDGSDFLLGGRSERKPRMYGNVEGVPTEEECRHKENNQAKEEKVSDALAEVRKHAKEAGFGPYKN